MFQTKIRTNHVPHRTDTYHGTVCVKFRKSGGVPWIKIESGGTPPSIPTSEKNTGAFYLTNRTEI